MGLLTHLPDLYSLNFLWVLPEKLGLLLLGQWPLGSRTGVCRLDLCPKQSGFLAGEEVVLLQHYGATPSFGSPSSVTLLFLLCLPRRNGHCFCGRHMCPLFWWVVGADQCQLPSDHQEVSLPVAHSASAPPSPARGGLKWSNDWRLGSETITVATGS